MRRRPGIAGLQNAAATRGQYRIIGDNVAKVRADLMKEQLATFRSQLEEFPRKHKACGYVMVEEVEKRLSWSSGRAADALETLLEEGLAMIDDGHKDEKRRYWFPCASSISSATGV